MDSYEFDPNDYYHEKRRTGSGPVNRGPSHSAYNPLENRRRPPARHPGSAPSVSKGTAVRTGRSTSPGYPSGRQPDYRRKKKKKYRAKPLLYVVIGLLIVAAALLIIMALGKGKTEGGKPQSGGQSASLFQGLKATATPEITATPEPTPEPTPTPKFDTPHASDLTAPENWGYTSDIEVDGTVMDSYLREPPIVFDTGDKYTGLEGVITFRGNNFRNTGSYGTAKISEKALSIAWTVETGEIMRGTSASYSGTWTGSLWTGQPLIVKWPQETKKVMNMFESAKNDPDLVEVIYATASGRIYFLDLKTGEATRNPVDLNMPFKGAGALDPRGYPLLYLGSGDMYDDYPEMQTRAMVISLIDGSVLYSFGKAYDPFAIRGWHAYDSSPLVSAETDTLIYPGENGIIYTVKLNTKYDEAAGTISVNPSEIAKYRYNTSRSSAGSGDRDKYWLGYESSVTIWGEYMYLASNDGFVHCINVNTLEPVWIQDIGDDANGSLVLEEDEANRTAYLYAGPTLHFTQNQDATGTVPMFKIDAVTGEILWRYERKVHTTSAARGGIQATAILGQGNISDLVIIPFERTYSSEDSDNNSLGYTVALNKYTGEKVWEKKTNFAWSSPVAVYDEDGNGYVIQPDSHGNIYFFDGLTGSRYSILDTKSKNFEATGAAYGNMFVIGNKDKKIFCVRIS